VNIHRIYVLAIPKNRNVVYNASMLKVVCLTSDAYIWAVQPFAYLFNIYWSGLQPVIIGGFKRPGFRLPSNFKFKSISPDNYPSDRWSDGLIALLNSMTDDHFVFVLEDYWLIRTVDLNGVKACHEYVKDRPDVLRIDLTDDRQYAGGVQDVEGWGHYDIVETPHGTPYQFSTQAGIWNRKLLLSLLKPNKTAWETEIHIQPREDMRVLGTRQSPMRYANAILKGKIDLDQIRRIPREHRAHCANLTPKEVLESGNAKFTPA